MKRVEKILFFFFRILPWVTQIRKKHIFTVLGKATSIIVKIINPPTGHVTKNLYTARSKMFEFKCRVLARAHRINTLPRHDKASVAQLTSSKTHKPKPTTKMKSVRSCTGLWSPKEFHLQGLSLTCLLIFPLTILLILNIWVNTSSEGSSQLSLCSHKTLNIFSYNIIIFSNDSPSSVLH